MILVVVDFMAGDLFSDVIFPATSLVQSLVLFYGRSAIRYLLLELDVLRLFTTRSFV